MFGKVLVIDDEALVLKSIERALAKVGHRVVTATGEDVDAGGVPLGGFDVLLMDLHMLGVKVSELVAKVRRESPGVRVMYISGAEPDDIDALDGEFLHKPFSIGELRGRVNEMLDKPAGG